MKQTIGYSEYKELLNVFVHMVQESMGEQVISIVLYGSVARGTATPNSDIDLLIVLREASSGYWGRLQPFLPILRRMKKESCWQRLDSKRLNPVLSLLVLSIEEASENRYIYLDMVEDALSLTDKERFFQSKLESLRKRLQELGSQKIRRDGDWYWDIKPDLKPGEVITL